MIQLWSPSFFERMPVRSLGLSGQWAVRFYLSVRPAWLLKRRDLQLRLYEKVAERRLTSHDAVIAMAKELRKSVFPTMRLVISNDALPCVSAPSILWMS